MVPTSFAELLPTQALLTYSQGCRSSGRTLSIICESRYSDNQTFRRTYRNLFDSRLRRGPGCDVVFRQDEIQAHKIFASDFEHLQASTESGDIGLARS